MNSDVEYEYDWMKICTLWMLVKILSESEYSKQICHKMGNYCT